MEVVIKIAVPLLLVMNYQFTAAFYTKKCTHDDLVTQLKGTICCFEKTLFDQIDKFSKGWKNNGTEIRNISENSLLHKTLCEIDLRLNKHISCIADHIGSCFNETLVGDFKLMGYWYLRSAYDSMCNGKPLEPSEEIKEKLRPILDHYFHYNGVFNDKNMTIDFHEDRVVGRHKILD